MASFIAKNGNDTYIQSLASTQIDYAVVPLSSPGACAPMKIMHLEPKETCLCWTCVDRRKAKVFNDQQAAMAKSEA